MFSTLSLLLGGLGLLLVGMSLMTDGLKLAAGNTLRDILALWTNSRVRGLFSGFLITGIVQSSSAVTVATIGFANAGMLGLEQAIWVIFGSNVGTTMTAWIVALVGFKVNIEVLAMPLVGIGALLKLTGSQSRRGSIGMALVGLGMLFLGIDGLKSAFEGVGQDYAPPGSEAMGLITVISLVGIGFLTTSIMQSSSAAMVIALSAAESGLLPFNGAAALVIGANLGTTTTAVLTVFGATPTARRVALAHVCFNVITAAVAILLLGPMLTLGNLLQAGTGASSSPAVSLALFHSGFNILGVILMWPLSRPMVTWLYRLFRTDEETESQPKHLDKNVLALPYIAVDALTLELSRVSTFCIQYLQQSLQPGGKSPSGRAVIIRNLIQESGQFTTQLNKTELTPFLAEAMLNLMYVMQEYLLTVEITEDIAHLSSQQALVQNSELQDRVHAFVAATDRMLDALTPDNTAEQINNPDYYLAVEKHYNSLKQIILMQTSFGNLQMGAMDDLLQYANQVKRAARHLWKGARRLNTVRESLQRNPADQVEKSTVTDTENIAILQDAAQELAQETPEADNVPPAA